eukprot:m.60956 g.60956  ORF g.60956 m.60956 type:complete len:119 (-) comp12319_c0_seq1:266-622(-)
MLELFRALPLTGAALIMPNGDLACGSGCGLAIQQRERLYFAGIFKQNNLEQEGINVFDKHFLVRETTPVQIVAVAPKNERGLVLLNLPYGVVVCLFEFPTTYEQIRDELQRVSHLLRS